MLGVRNDSLLRRIVTQVRDEDYSINLKGFFSIAVVDFLAEAPEDL